MSIVDPGGWRIKDVGLQSHCKVRPIRHSLEELGIGCRTDLF